MVKRWYGPVRRRPAIAGFGVALAMGAILSPAAEADAPPCRYTINIPADTVLDNDTGLTWQRTTDGTSYTWSNAALYCEDLPLAGGGWRLPSIQELQTIVDDGTYNPAIDSTAFPNTPVSSFWSSSVYAGNPGSAWVVYFLNGYVYYDDVDGTRRVRCVR